ncbi:NADPH-dependent FMN reductase [Neptunitalea lumnitzerae]|uniref:FMN reductase n=1 Tax=Neptunitalea lumnitzerae TaxID=2965509 RepID=A0ABQ5MKG9_9FLAO|nr:NAD(P)H-dependent oxidoreductase [Neptunitalea sp. Y10]GLB49811.1 FMN reductase [Neptunitalea sp. Y10]
MKKIIAFAGSNSSKSINYQLIKYTASLIEEAEVDALDMSGIAFPIYSEDIERTEGFKNSLVELINYIKQADGLIISVNEHNGTMSAYFKNLIDWMSRFNAKFLEGKKVFLMSTSNGKLGGKRSLEAVKLILPFFGAEIITTFSLPQYNEHFSPEKGITEDNFKKMHQESLQQFLASLA